MFDIETLKFLKKYSTSEYQVKILIIIYESIKPKK